MNSRTVQEVALRGLGDYLDEAHEREEEIMASV